MIKVETKFRTSFNQVVNKVRTEVAEALREALPEEQKEIVQRTQSGQSVEGGGFAPYSSAYARAKARLVGSASPVNLTLTGAMLGSLKNRVRRVSGGQVEGTIEVTGGFNRNKAEWNQGGNENIPARRFMGLSREQTRRLNRVVRQAVSRALNRS